jgi:hypothetical protein
VHEIPAAFFLRLLSNLLGFRACNLQHVSLASGFRPGQYVALAAQIPAKQKSGCPPLLSQLVTAMGRHRHRRRTVRTWYVMVMAHTAEAVAGAGAWEMGCGWA